MNRWMNVLIWLVVFLLIFCACIPISPVNALPDRTLCVTLLLRWTPVGIDRDDAPLPGKVLFPWQSPGQSVWGSEKYPMRKNSSGEIIQPLYYAVGYLSPHPNKDSAKALDPLYIVMDDAGQLWFDEDGRFQNSLYDPLRDPDNPSFTAGTCQQTNRLDGQIRYSVDPDSGNNTRGPYPFSYLADTTRNYLTIDDRTWKVGFLDRQDYLENGEIKPKDWDIGFPLISFRQDEKHADNRTDNHQYDAFEWIYRSTHSFVQPGDTRLSPVAVMESGITYAPQTIVQPEDKDVGIPLVAFSSEEQHTEHLQQDNRFTVQSKWGYDVCQEYLYREAQNTVGTASIRLNPVNVRIDTQTYQLQQFGLHYTDMLILTEIPSTNRSYTFVLETNLVSLGKKELSFSIRSPYNDIPFGSSSVSSGKWVEGDSLLSASYFESFSPDFTGAFGLSLFIDNGVNNQIANRLTNTPVRNNLSDDFVQEGQSEEILGVQNRSGSLDISQSLRAFTPDVAYYSSGGGEIGTGSPLYQDKDLSGSVSVGDERLIASNWSVNQMEAVYDAGTTVAEGDLDVSFLLQPMPSYCYYRDQHPSVADFTNNHRYDCGEGIYKKDSTTSVTGMVQAGDLRLTKVSVCGTVYPAGSRVEPVLFFFHPSKLIGFTMQSAHDFRFLDIPVACGEESMEVTPSHAPQVELTTTYQIQVEPLQPGESFFLIVDEPNRQNRVDRLPLFRQQFFYPWNGVAEITISPYRSSFLEKGMLAPMSFIGWREKGGSPQPYVEYRDQVRKQFFYESILDERILKYQDLLPKPFYPDDCTIREVSVLPEGLSLSPSKKCFSSFDQRFPNAWIQSTDQDNPFDINDPHAVLTSYENQTLTGNVNAHGAGIDYLATATGYFAENPSHLQRFVIQVNLDQSYYIWLWIDKKPYDFFNFGDELVQEPMKILQYPRWSNNDCSEPWFFSSEDPLPMNRITPHDYLGIFDGEAHEVAFGDIKRTLLSGTVFTFGLPAYIEPINRLNEGDPGGDFPICLLPIWEKEPIRIRFYSLNARLDYNSSTLHDAFFVEDTYPSLNYVGYTEVNSSSIEPVNFTNHVIVDHALAFSDTNYTAGKNALSPMQEPKIVSPYLPLVQDLERDFIAYPGGQAHVVRTAYRIGSNRRFRRGAQLGYNAYPSITQALDPTTYFRKLGQENAPLTDYSFYFTLQSKTGEYLRFDPNAPLHLQISKIEVTGPFKTTKILHTEDGSVIPETGYPITYLYGGKLEITREISRWYQSKGEDWTTRIGFGRNEIRIESDSANPLLVRTRLLDYTGFPYVIRIPEVIPTGGGRLRIKVFVADGTVAEWGDCCSKDPSTGIRVHGLEVEGVPDELELNVDHVLKPVIKEYEPFQQEPYCNDALVYLWQDRGIQYHDAMLRDPIEMGAGDGQININAVDWLDLNLDGKIAFGDFETEIIGTYDLASNTWAGGLYDGRTFNVNNGLYPLNLTEANDARITQFGSDFGSRLGRQFSFQSDHIISSDEECPVYITAYKFYDDNNDRAFTPTLGRRSHEVYLAGEKRIRMKPQEDLVVDYYPYPLTAGVIPEIVDPASPFTILVQDTTGRPMDFRFGAMDPGGRSEVYPPDIHQHLFDDTPSEPLPQHYWIRTDLHNSDLGDDCNSRMYSKKTNTFAPIQVDFSKSYEGKYRFMNFCANDEGLFEVRVYTPDHLHMGRVFVRVANPQVEYLISPLMVENNFLRGFMNIQDPDFVMTAGANKFYILSLKAFNAQKQLIKGIDKKNPFRNPDERDRVVHAGRLTPYTSKPASFDLARKFQGIPSPYFLHMSLMEDPDRIQLRSPTIFALKGFSKDQSVYYNTSNMQYDNGHYSQFGTIEQNTGLTLNDGWGMGCIYNSPREGAYMFPDFNKDGLLSREDSFEVGPDGSIQFILFAEDVCRMGVLVGANYYTDSMTFGDVAGKPPRYSEDPRTIRGRFRKEWDSINGYSNADQVFGLDWDAFPERDLAISHPLVSIYQAKTGLPFRRDLLNPGNYDLVYALENHILVQVRPADPRDFPVNDGQIRLTGNTSEAYCYGDIVKAVPTAYTVFSYMPTGVGEDVSSLLYTSYNLYYNLENPLFEGPGYYAVDLNTSFDVIKALQIQFPSGSRVYQNRKNSLVISIKEKGTLAPVKDVTVSVSWPGQSKLLTTNEKGECSIEMMPDQPGQIRVYAFKESFIEEEIWIPIIDSD